MSANQPRYNMVSPSKNRHDRHVADSKCSLKLGILSIRSIDKAVKLTRELGECVCSQSVARNLLFKEAYDFYFRQIPSTAYICNTTKLGLTTVSSQC
jgi:hypothetical protein